MTCSVGNAFASELWRRTTIALARAVRQLGKQHGVKLRVSYGKVAEYQARGVVHFHALLRLDLVDPTDPDARPPTPADDHRRRPRASCSPAPSPPPGTRRRSTR